MNQQITWYVDPSDLALGEDVDTLDLTVNEPEPQQPPN